MNDERPNPDALLNAIQKGEARQQRGKLRIFFGMAAGVGKTYAMLDAARTRIAEDVDVAVGYVETHGRAETELLLAGLEIVPRQKLIYRDTTLEEMNLDAILERAPQLVLVDELAHSNVPGARHTKRWQDVIELLDAGIDVYTTVNVQHFESRADAVKQITGVTVHETVPDSMLDLANEIELIDVSPEDLRKRLAEGKVYTSERVETAAHNFFRMGNLTALREMALRLTAEHVDHQLQDYMQVKHIAGPWKSGERLMVAVGASPFSEQLIRWTRRMAYNLEAPWLAVHVQPTQPLSEQAQENLTQNLALARSLGAEVITTFGVTVTEALLNLARQRNVTQIVIGKPMHSGIQRLLRGSLVDKLIRHSGDIDIYVVTGDKTQGKRRSLLPTPLQQHSKWRQYVWALTIIAVITIVDLLLLEGLPWLSYLAVGLTDLVAVLLIAVYMGRGPALLAAALSALTWNFLFIEPRFTFDIRQIQDIILFLLYFVIAIFTGNLTARLRTQERQARHNAERTMALYALAHETATAVNMDDVLHTAVTQIGRVFNSDVAILLPKTADGNRLEPLPHTSSTLEVDSKDYSVATWAFENSKPAGRYTDTLPLAKAQYLPLRTPSRVVGVIGIANHRDERPSFDQAVLLETFVSQVALVIEREMLDEAAEQSAMLRESERLYTTLLNSISHELRTPIATVKGAASSLLNPMMSSNASVRVELASDIQSAADRLNRLVENLLDMSRLESGRLRLKWEWCDISDIIAVSVKQLADCTATHRIQIETAPDLPLVYLDFGLIEQVLVNLLDNACRYAPVGTFIQIKARVTGQELELEVSDDGPGIPDELRERVFEKFYRMPGTATGGTGLGLSISRGLVEAHGGNLTVESVAYGGSRFVLHLPLTGSPPPVREANHE
jgi:two-component system, OmpR family, sensor histidine kinase KdpD